MKNHAKEKVDAIYDLRAAAEEKGRAESAVDNEATRENKDALLHAQMALEENTLRALDACGECGHEHAPDEPHSNSLINVDFGAQPQC